MKSKGLTIGLSAVALCAALGGIYQSAALADSKSSLVDDRAAAQDVAAARKALTDRHGDDDAPRSWESLHGCEEDGYAKVEVQVLLDRAVRALPSREQQIIRLRFGADLSQAEIGTALGISQMHVSRMLRRGLDRVGTIVSGSGASAGAH